MFNKLTPLQQHKLLAEFAVALKKYPDITNAPKALQELHSGRSQQLQNLCDGYGPQVGCPTWNGVGMQELHSEMTITHNFGTWKGNISCVQAE